MKLITPPGELEAKVEADPPRIDSMRLSVRSGRMKVSGVISERSPNSRTGSPSYWNWTYLEPNPVSGRPRIV